MEELFLVLVEGEAASREREPGLTVVVLSQMAMVEVLCQEVEVPLTEVVRKFVMEEQD